MVAGGRTGRQGVGRVCVLLEWENLQFKQVAEQEDRIAV
jgi:ERCC4-related helicase